MNGFLKHSLRNLGPRVDRPMACLVSAAFLSLLVAGFPASVLSHDHARGKADDKIKGDLIQKRFHGTGKGMPSIRGPFPDTVNMEFLGQLTNDELGVSRLIFTGASFLSDIWGWTSPSGDEYAIVGTSSGVAFARITDPANPEYLGIIPTTNDGTLRNFWWDIKTFNNHAYYTTDVNGAGIGIFELTQLDDMDAVPPGTELDVDARYDENGYIRGHNISINEDTGFAYITGVSKDPAVDPGFTDDGTIILDLNGDPLAPVEVGEILGIDSHDAHVVTYAGPDVDYQGREIAAIFNGLDEELGIYDVTDKDNMNRPGISGGCLV